jgi:hypothetical protein
MSVVDQQRYAATPLTGTIGAVISGIDPSEPVDEETAAFLRSALSECRVSSTRRRSATSRAWRAGFQSEAIRELAR